MSSLKYLKKREWSMGNGQCPDCCGVHKGWLGHPLYLDGTEIGHEPKCSLAVAIADAGGKPLYGSSRKKSAAKISGLLAVCMSSRILIPAPAGCAANAGFQANTGVEHD